MEPLGFYFFFSAISFLLRHIRFSSWPSVCLFSKYDGVLTKIFLLLSFSISAYFSNSFRLSSLGPKTPSMPVLTVVLAAICTVYTTLEVAYISPLPKLPARLITLTEGAADGISTEASWICSSFISRI